MSAGCVTAAGDLGACLREAGHDVSVSLADDDQPATRAAVAAQPRLARCTLGDLRIVPLPPRSADLVACSRLLDRISHAELVLDRLVTALKPGGLLLLQIRDRDCAAAFLDRVLPGPLRKLAWRRMRPGQPGPHPAVYEALSSARGVQAYVQHRGLVVVESRVLGGRAGGSTPASQAGTASQAGRTPLVLAAAQRMISMLSRGRLPDTHEELVYVVRKPEDRFARVL